MSIPQTGWPAWLVLMSGLAGCPKPGMQPADGDTGQDHDGEQPQDGHDLEAPPVLAFAGDAMLGRNFNGVLADRPDFVIWRNLQTPLADVDLMGFNLETTLTSADNPWPDKAYNFKLDPALAPAALDSLPLAGESRRYVSLANNHILDFQEPGLLDTLSTLEQLGISRAGAGRDLEQARAATIVETSAGTRIGFLSASTHCGCGDAEAWAAGASEPGMWYLPGRNGDWAPAVRAVQSLEPEVDVVVFSLHWGPNWVEDWPIPWMRELATVLVEAGVDVIHGHSSHHILPVETIQGKTVLYGTGDFVDDYALHEEYRSDLGFIAKIRFAEDGSQDLEVIPTRIFHDDGHYVRALAPSDPDHDVVLEMADAPRAD